MQPVRVFIETGKRRTFAGALDWPGWCRGSPEASAALQALLSYAPRYAQVLRRSGIDFVLPGRLEDFSVVERLAGDVSTDFGAPAASLQSDLEPMKPGELERLKPLLGACWAAFTQAAAQAAGHELQKGPLGGGRDLEKIVAHVLEAERAYLRRLAWKHLPEGSGHSSAAIERFQHAALAALDSAVTQGLPESGPRGGKLWTPRYFIRRSAWHILDHAWEIEDRVVPSH